MAIALKAIETTYRGYRFRSRTEARWAVFMDAAGVAWEYEVEGYDLDGIRYLPDFVVRQRASGGSAEFWFEVKPTCPTPGDRAWTKAARLSTAGDPPRAVVVAMGQPDITVGLWLFHRGGRFTDFRWTRCYRCGLVLPVRDGKGESLPCGCFRKNVDSYLGWNDPVLLEAFEAARAERFGT